MMFAPRVIAAVAMFGSVAGAIPARAADVTPAQATELEAGLRGWMAGLLSPAVDVGARPIQASADGDHFNVVLPAPEILSSSGVTSPGLAVKLKAKPLDGGRWALDDLVIPMPLTLSAPKGMPTDAAGQSLTVSADTQEFHGIFDPSYATTSSFDSMVTGLRIAGANSVGTSGRSASHSTWQPAGDGRINVLMEGNSEKTSNTVSPKDGQPFTYTIEKSTSSSRINAVSPATLATLIRSISAMVPTMATTKDSLNPEQRTLARNIIFSLRDLTAGFEAGQKLNNIKFSAEGHSGTITRAGFGTKMGVVDGKLELATEISVEGVDSPEIPKGIYRDYLPRKITLKPRVSGIPSEDLVKLLLRAVDSDAKDMADLQEAAIALLGSGPLEVAIDELGIDLGRASLTGTGSLDIASMTDITGEAEINVKGLDALIKTANTTPDLKQIAPVLIFIKGIGKQDGDTTTWNIAYQDNNVTVNDTDLSSLMPGSGKK